MISYRSRSLNSGESRMLTHDLVDALEVASPAFLFPILALGVPPAFHSTLNFIHDDLRSRDSKIEWLRLICLVRQMLGESTYQHVIACSISRVLSPRFGKCRWNLAAQG